MSDNKTIQDALAEVQRKINEEREARVAEMISEVQRGERYNPKTGKYEAPIRKLKPDTSVGKQTLTPEAPKAAPSTPKPDVAGRMSSSGTALGKATGTSVPPTGAPSAATTGKTLSTLGKVGGAASMAGTGALGAAAVGGMASGALGALATGTETGREIGRKIGQTEIGKTVADVARKAGEAIGIREPSQSKPAETPKPTELPKIDVPAKQTTPAPSQSKKTEPSSFGAAFKAAREKATEMGKPSTGQFEYKGKEYQTNIKGEKYVPMPQQTKVDSASTPKPADVPLPPKRPADLSKPAPEESESGGKKKKMSEDTNPLIAAFLKLQENNPSNMFEAAKKAKKDYDKDGKIESPKDEVWGSRFAAAKKAGKMEEANIDPVVTGSSSVTKSKTGYVDPSTPTQPYTKAPMSTGAGDIIDKAKGALDKKGVQQEEVEIDEVSKSLAGKTIMGRAAKGIDAEYSGDEKTAASHYDKFKKSKELFGKKFGQKAADKMTHAVGVRFNAEEVEEVTFSQAEIDHINSFFLEASVAPNRPEVATGADSVSDKMSQNDVTGTAESGGKKKTNEEVEEIDEILSASPKRKVPDWIKRKRNFNGRHDLVKAGNLNYDGSKKKSEKEPKKDDVKEDTIPHKQNDVDPKFKSNILTPPKAPVKQPKWKDKGPYRLVTPNTVKPKEGFMKETLEEHKSMEGETLKPGDQVGFKDGHEKYGRIHSINNDGHAKIKVWNDMTGTHDHVTKHVSRLWKEANEEVIQEGRPKKNPTPETTERDPRKHIQVEAGRAAAGNVIDFHHNDGTKSKLTPAMGRKIVAHLNNLKPADRQTAVNKMHDSAEGLKV